MDGDEDDLISPGAAAVASGAANAGASVEVSAEPPPAELEEEGQKRKRGRPKGKAKAQAAKKRRGSNHSEGDGEGPGSGKPVAKRKCTGHCKKTLPSASFAADNTMCKDCKNERRRFTRLVQQQGEETWYEALQAGACL